jgi:hypothetical protein
MGWACGTYGGTEMPAAGNLNEGNTSKISSSTVMA